MAELRWVGKPVPRIDALDKVTGIQKYMGDLVVEGMAYGKVVRSAHPHARISGIDTTEAMASPGVIAVLTWKDITGLNGYGIVVPDQPVLCRDKVRYMGDAVALVVAESMDEAVRAASAVKVDYELLPVVDDAEKAMEEDAPKVHESGNIHQHTRIEHGDVDAAFAGADLIVEHVYNTSRQMHAFLEPESGLGVPNPDGTVTIYCGSQHPFRDQLQVARALGIRPSSIRIVSNPTGGAFGGKDEITLQILLALGAKSTGRPVKIVLTREESVVAGWKRHPMRIYMKTGVLNDGTMVAQEVKVIADTGAYASLGGPVTNLCLENVCGIYRVPNVRLDGFCVYTNNGVAGAFRGFGVPQAVFAMEMQMDYIAEALSMDRLEIRMKNALKGGDLAPTGHRMTEAIGTMATLEQVAKSVLWSRMEEYKAKASAPYKKRGVGIAAVLQGTGLGYGLPDYGAALIRLARDGKFIVSLSCPEIGQGNSTTYAQMAAECLGCHIQNVEVRTGDTALGPDSGSCTASRSVYTGGKAIAQAAQAMVEILRRRSAEILGCTEDQVQIGSEGFRYGDRQVSLAELAETAAAQGTEVSTDGAFIWPVADKGIPGAVGLPHIINSYVAQVALVEVDEMTGEVEVLEVESVVDAGRVVNPQGLTGQSEGGIVMGMGYALMEDTVIEAGITKTSNFSTYMIPTSLDVPEMRTTIVEVMEPTGPFGAKGIGEAVMVPTAPAILSAVKDAIGVAPHTIPATSERVYEAMCRGKGW